jgi:2-hydroxychromene-2-carboxylate isomerase
LKTVEFYFDVGSPAAYIAWTQLPRIAAETGASVDYKPMLLGGVFQATGNHSPTTVPAKGKYMMDDLGRFAARHGVPFTSNPHFPINTLMLMRGAVGLQMRDPEHFFPYVDAVYKATWAQAKNMNDPQVVGEVLQAAGFNPMHLIALAGDQAVKDRLKQITQGAVERGVFGAPTFFIGGQMHWGQDRLDFVKQALEDMQ